MMMPTSNANRSQYLRDAVLSATPVRLLTMLYDRLLLDLGRARAAQENEDWDVARENLLHAQAILSELSSSLRPDVWDGAEGLRAVYSYASNALVASNIHRDIRRTIESIELLEPLRQAWHEAAQSLPAPSQASPPGSLGVG